MGWDIKEQFGPREYELDSNLKDVGDMIVVNDEFHVHKVVGGWVYVFMKVRGSGFSQTGVFVPDTRNQKKGPIP